MKRRYLYPILALCIMVQKVTPGQWKSCLWGVSLEIIFCKKNLKSLGSPYSSDNILVSRSSAYSVINFWNTLWIFYKVPYAKVCNAIAYRERLVKKEERDGDEHTFGLVQRIFRILEISFMSMIVEWHCGKKAHMQTNHWSIWICKDFWWCWE